MHECAAVWRCMLLGMIVIEAQKYCSARKYAIKILNFTTMHATCHNSISDEKSLSQLVALGAKWTSDGMEWECVGMGGGGLPALLGFHELTAL